MTVNYCKLNHVVTSITISVSAVVSLLKHINTSLGTWHIAINLANAFFHPIPVNKDHHNISFQLARPAIPLHCPTSGIHQLSRVCHNLVSKGLICLSILQGSILVYYIDDIILIKRNEEEVAITLDLLIKHLRA